MRIDGKKEHLMSGSLDWNRDLGISKDSQTSTYPLRSKLAFHAILFTFHLILLSFHVSPKRFSQNQKGNTTKYFAKSLGNLELSLWDLLRNVENFNRNILAMVGSPGE